MNYYLLAAISVFSAITVYFIVLLLIPKSEKEIVEERVSKYFKGKSLDDVETMVIEERRKKA